MALGDIEVTDSNVETEVNTASGNVTLTGICAHGVKVDVASGDVTLRGLTVPELASGEITFARALALAMAISGSGQRPGT